MFFLGDVPGRIWYTDRRKDIFLSIGIRMESSAQAVVSGGKKPASPIIRWAFIIGITIVSNLFLMYLVDVIYPQPDYAAFCPDNQVNRAIESESACLEIGGQWNEGVDAKIRMAEPATPVSGNYCNTTYTCSKQFEESMKIYNRNVFVVFVIAGILLLLGSVSFAGSEVLSLAFSFGGVLAFLIGATRYWSDMDDMLRVLILGIALASLVSMAWKKFKE